jgi:uncharacterized protein (DUF2141 family)
MNYLKPFILFVAIVLISVVFLAACANIGTVEGGPRDTQPPQIIRSVPENESIRFTAKGFTLFFDEFLQPGGIANDISVSPPLKEKVKATLRGKVVDVEWTDTLKENTTYTFQFGDGLKDLNEGNIQKKYIYVFSTGDYLDSLTMTGKVMNVWDKSPLKGAIVALYEWGGETSDSTPISQKPYYYTIAEDNGTFTFRYLKGGKYRLLAFDDQNGNFKYDNMLETGGFIPYPVNPENEDIHQIISFEPQQKLRLLDQKIFHRQGIKLVFNRRLDSISFQFFYPEIEVPQHYFNEEKDTVTIWLPVAIQDSVKFSYQTISKTDTLKLKPRQRMDFKPKIKRVFGENLAPDKPAAFISNIPLIHIDTALAFIKKDSLILNIDSVEIFPDGKFITHFYRKATGQYRMVFPPGSVIYLDEKQQEDTLFFNFEILEKDEYGKLEFTVKPGRMDSLLLRITSGENIFFSATVNDTASFILPYVPPGAYKMEAIVDWNGNGRWDPGDFMRNLLPEPVIRNREEIQIKANWDIEYTWEIPADEIKRMEDMLKPEEEVGGDNKNNLEGDKIPEKE